MVKNNKTTQTHSGGLAVIDGNSLANRAFYALPPLTNKQGQQTNAVLGFLNMLIKVIVEYRPKYLAVAFDLPHPTHRHLKYAEYKATRKSMPEELKSQMPLIKRMLESLDIAIVEKIGFEADDILGALSKKASEDKLNNYIVTGDRDCFQLINNYSRVVLTRRGISEVELYDTAKLKADFLLSPAQIVDYKAIAGDSSDNIPGVAGIGEKGATTLLGEFGSLDGIYNNIDNVKGKLQEKLIAGKEAAYLSKELATIDTAVPMEKKYTEFSFSFPFTETAKQFFIEQDFNSILRKSQLFSHGHGKEVPADIEKTTEEVKLSIKSEVEKFIAGVKDTVAISLGNSVGISTETKKEVSIEIRQTLLDTGLDFNEVLVLLKPLLENAAVKKIIFDAKKLLKQLYPLNIGLVNYFDVPLAQYLVDFSLASKAESVLLESYSLDGFKPAAGLLFLYKSLSEKLASLNQSALYYEVELPLVEVLFEMEKEGFRLDREYLIKTGEEFVKRALELAEQIQNMANQQFNINSPKQLAKVLFEDLKISYPFNRSKADKESGKFSTAVEVLEAIDHPIISLVQEYRSIVRLNSTFVDGLLRAMDSNDIVRTQFRQTLTSTGRLSSIEPNLQNIPIRTSEGQRLRGAFIAKSEDRVLICADYSQIELRLLAHFSGDEIMRQAFLEGDDIHTKTASKVFKIAEKDVTSEQRRSAKAVNFGIIYGMSDFGLAKQLKINRFKAKQFIEDYFANFPKIKQYLDNSIRLAKQNGYAETILGRRRPIAELNSQNAGIRNFGERAAMNMPLQGSAADIIKVAMNKIAAVIKNTNAKLLLQVHDELIIECDKKDADEISEKLKEQMQTAAELSVPLVVDIRVGEKWGK